MKYNTKHIFLCFLALRTLMLIALIISVTNFTLSSPFLKKAPSNLSEKKPVNHKNEEKNHTASQSDQKSNKIPRKTYPEDLNITNHNPLPEKNDPHPLIKEYVAGKSNENRPINCIELGEGEETILILATIHGNENAGTPLVRKLSNYLYKHPQTLQGRKVILLPLVNPDGELRNSRFNSNGVDLNRNFDTANRVNNQRYGFTPLSEPESQTIAQTIHEHNPSRIITLHQPLTCIDYDGPGKSLARHMAKYCDLPVRKLGAMPGSLGSYAGLSLNIPTITLELPDGVENSDSETLWKLYGTALIASVLYPDEPGTILQAKRPDLCECLNISLP